MNEFREILLQNFKADWLFLRWAGLRGLSAAAAYHVKASGGYSVIRLQCHKKSASIIEP
jgi:hypothetical protein